MIGERFCLFYAGFTAYAPSAFFGQLSLLGEVQVPAGDHAPHKLSTELSAALPDLKEEIACHLRTVKSIADYFELRLGELPEDSQDYREWLNETTAAFETQFPMSRIDHYYFLYARKVAEVLSNTRLSELLIDIALEGSMIEDARARTEKFIRDSEFILFKLVAAAALLSSEPRQNYFNVFYRQMNSDFREIAACKPVDMTDAQLEELKGRLQVFYKSVEGGFKKCIGLLKELNS